MSTSEKKKRYLEKIKGDPERLEARREASRKWKAKAKAQKESAMKTPEQRAKQAAYMAKWREANPERAKEIAREYMRRKRAGLPAKARTPKVPAAPQKTAPVAQVRPVSIDGRSVQAERRIVWVPVLALNEFGEAMTAYRGRTKNGLSLPVQMHTLCRPGHLQPTTRLYYIDGDFATYFSEASVTNLLEKVGLL